MVLFIGGAAFTGLSGKFGGGREVEILDKALVFTKIKYVSIR